MTFTKEENEKILEVLKKIDNYVLTIPMEESFILNDPWGKWSFKINIDIRKGERFAKMVLFNDKYLPNYLSKVIENNCIYQYPNEINDLIRNWNYIKGELLKESERQIKKKREFNLALDNFNI